LDPSLEKFQPSPKVSSTVIKKIDVWTGRENPPTQLEMAKRLKLSPRTVGRVIKDKLDKKVRVKTTVHALKPSHIPTCKPERGIPGSSTKVIWLEKSGNSW
jgi:hypothetical protein